MRPNSRSLNLPAVKNAADVDVLLRSAAPAFPSFYIEEPQLGQGFVILRHRGWVMMPVRKRYHGSAQRWFVSQARGPQDTCLVCETLGMRKLKLANFLPAADKGTFVAASFAVTAF